MTNRKMELETMERRTWTDKYGIEHQAIDYYSNAKCKWMAARKAVGSNYKEDVEQWLGTEHLIIQEGGTNGRWYVCWID